MCRGVKLSGPGLAHGHGSTSASSVPLTSPHGDISHSDQTGRIRPGICAALWKNIPPIIENIIV